MPNEFFCHRLAEMDVIGERSLKEISEELGVSTPTVQKMRETDAYRKVFDKAKRESERAVQSRLRESTVLTKTKLATYANEAVDIVMELARNADKDSVRLGAACEILDRDGRFAKVSRLMNVQQGSDGAPMLPEDTAAEILDSLKRSKPTTESVQ